MTEVLADRYELRELLGAGGMARVVEGYDRLLARRVAIKILRDDIGGDPRLPERFLREARAAASFSHPNAVAVYDTGRDDGTPFIVMELVEGRTLADELAERGALPAGEAVQIAERVLDALSAAHERGLVHRDVKPGNVLLPRAGGVKLTDFGIAKSLRDAAAGLTATGTVLGTPRYLAPEQVAGDPALPATDVYATGVVLYEMLAGDPPFDGDNAIAVALAHQREKPPPLRKRRRDLDEGLVAVVDRALEKDPAARYLDAAEMRSALLDLPGGVTPLGDAASTPTVAVPRGRDRTEVLDEPAPRRERPRRDPAPPPPAGRGAVVGLVVVVAVLIAAAVLAATLAGGGGDPGDDPSAPVEEVVPDPEPAPQPEEPADEAPADEAPADEAPADEAPADEEPADEEPAPVEPAPEQPADGASEAP